MPNRNSHLRFLAELLDLTSQGKSSLSRGGKEVYTYPPMLVWGSWYGNKTSRKNCTSLEVGVLALYLKDCPSSSIK